MSAWQHPLERCDACGQDILLRPDITNDARLTYVQYCPRCDADEPVVTRRERAPWADRPIDAESFWAMTGDEVRDNTAAAQAPVASTPPPAPPVGSPPRRDTSSASGLDLWWDGADRSGQHRGSEADSLDARWARFVAAGEEDDEDMSNASEGSFAFGGEDAPRRKRMRFRLRQSA